MRLCEAVRTHLSTADVTGDEFNYFQSAILAVHTVTSDACGALRPSLRSLRRVEGDDISRALVRSFRNRLCALRFSRWWSGVQVSAPRFNRSG